MMKDYTKKYCDMVSTTRTAANRMAPVLRGMKAADELKSMRAATGIQEPHAGNNCA